jgi:hypothetical protein
MVTLSLTQLPSAAAVREIPVHDSAADFDAKQAEDIVGGLSKTSKMPGYSISISARRCNVGTKLRKVKGSTCEKCYACKGMYNFPNVQNAMERRYNALFDPRWVAAMSHLITKKCKKIAYFRWHDSGDIQSLNHLINIVQVCQNTPHISHWLPTREYAIVRKYLAIFGDFPPNLVVRVSAAMLDSAAPSDFAHTSEVATDENAMNASRSRGGVACVAPKQNNECRDCRACWSRDVSTVTYYKH